MLLSTWITGATNTWPIITDRNSAPLVWFRRFLRSCGVIIWSLFLSFGITDQLCSIYPPRPCNREATELRTAYPYHGNLTPPRISPSRFREYHYHPGCHRLHEKLSHGLWSGFSLLPPLPDRLEDHGVPHKWLSPGLMSQCLAIQFSRCMREFRKDPSTYISSLGGQKGTPSIWEN